MQLSEKTSSPRNMALRQRGFRWSIGKISDSLAKFFLVWGAECSCDSPKSAHSASMTKLSVG